MDNSYSFIENDRGKGKLKTSSAIHGYLLSVPSKQITEDGFLLKKDKRVAVYVLGTLGQEPIVCKALKVNSVLGRLLISLGLSRVQRNDRVTAVLINGGVNTPEALGYFFENKNNRVCVAWAFSPFINESSSLLSLAQSEQLSDYLLGSEILQNLAEQLNRLHLLGYVHGDLKWANILIENDDVWLVDLDAVRVISSRKPVERDLARFMLDCKEAGCDSRVNARFLELYCQLSGKNFSDCNEKVALLLKKLEKRHTQRYGKNHKLQPRSELKVKP